MIEAFGGGGSTGNNTNVQVKDVEDGTDNYHYDDIYFPPSIKLSSVFNLFWTILQSFDWSIDLSS